jgi:putative hydrolase of the HAD superfamily
LLILFDLDDTLIDTSGCIVPIKLRDGLEKMVQAGLVVPDFQAALSRLYALNQKAASSREALKEFLSEVGFDERLYEVGVHEVYRNISPTIPVTPFPGVLKTLEKLERDHTLALVTLGVPSQQMAKVKNAGIDSRFFSKIAVFENQSKKVYYQSIATEFKADPSSVIVCGDRVHADLLPARELGFKTVLVRQGRGIHEPLDMTDHVIGAVPEILDLVEKT